MKFIALEIENIFAYDGLSRIDLSGTTADRNIIIVSGRNGAGKTSLLNAVKLLFLGPNDERLRRVGFGNTVITAKQYVLGQPGRWYGVFNSASRATVAHVMLEWIDGDRKFRARRTFRAKKMKTDFDEELLVTVNDVPLDADPTNAALGKATLHQLLPPEVVPFFFFDGEQIQSLADAEIGREQAEIERLLGLSFVAHLLGVIDGYAREKARAGLPDDVRVKVIAAENAAREARARAEAQGRARVQEEERRLDIERTRRRLDDDRNRLRGGAMSDSERRRIEGRIAVLQYQREELAAKIAEALPQEAPFLTNHSLVEDAFRLLDGHIGAAADNTLSARLHRELPPGIAQGLADMREPVSLDEPQREDLAGIVSTALEKIGVKQSAPGNPLLNSLSANRAKNLRDQFLVWSQRGPISLGAQQDDLRSMRQLVGELQRIQRELDEAELTTDEAKAQFVEISGQIEKLDGELQAMIERIAEIRIDEQRALREIGEQEQRVAQLEDEHRDVSRQNSAYRLALRAKQALERYRDLRRSEIRASVETRLNERVGILLGPSQLIKSVTLDEHFVMSYFDERNAEVARHSISAGMRQLLAMAMLWALKDEAQRPLPVIVDTPLGRIDRTNRSLLMREYFPNAGNPLLLLPTDTEFGPDGFEQIGERICRRYRIENNGGDSARLVEEPLGAAGARQ